METKEDILLLGIGAIGTQIAYYIFQNESIDHLRIMGADTDSELVDKNYSMSCFRLLPSPFTKEGDFAQKCIANIGELLEIQLSDVKMLCILTCIGDHTSNFYGPIARDIAAQKSIPATIIALLPPGIQKEEDKQVADSELKKLISSCCDVIPLHSEHFCRLFPNQKAESLVQQSIVWASHTVLGYLKLLLQPPIVEQDPNGEIPLSNEELAKQPMGIFANVEPTYVKLRNLDIPTFVRKRIKLD